MVFQPRITYQDMLAAVNGNEAALHKIENAFNLIFDHMNHPTTAARTDPPAPASSLQKDTPLLYRAEGNPSVDEQPVGQ